MIRFLSFFFLSFTIYFFLATPLNSSAQIRKQIKKDTSQKIKSYWDSYREHTDENWPFFCANWGNTKSTDHLPVSSVIQLLDSPIYVTDVWDNNYQVKQFRFYYKNIEYTQNDTTLSFEPIYIGYSFYDKAIPFRNRWKQFIFDNLEPNETLIIDNIYITDSLGSGFIVYDPITINTY